MLINTLRCKINVIVHMGIIEVDMCNTTYKFCLIINLCSLDELCQFVNFRIGFSKIVIKSTISILF